MFAWIVKEFKIQQKWSVSVENELFFLLHLQEFIIKSNIFPTG